MARSNQSRPASHGATLIHRHWPLLEQRLTALAQQSDAAAILRTAFGAGHDADRAGTILDAWRAGSFSKLPTCHAVPSDVLNNAQAGYVAADHAILLNRDWLAGADEEEILRVLLEEVGHGLDRQINDDETPGDEGAIFAGLVLGDALDADDLARLRAEDDLGWIILDGRLVQVEYSASLTEDQLAQLREGIAATLDNVEDAIAAQALNQSLPLFGDDLHQSFVGGTAALNRLGAARAAIDQALAALTVPQGGAQVQAVPTILLQQAADAINAGLQNAGLIPNGATPATVTPGNEININTGLLGATYSQTLQSQTGFGLFNVIKASSDGSVNLGVNYGVNLTVGVDTDFYVRTNTTGQEVTLNLSVATAPNGASTNPNLTVGGDVTVGPFQVFSATVLPTTGLSAAFQLDLQDADGKLYLNEINNTFSYASTTASGDLDLDLRLGTPQALDGLLKLRTDLQVDWSFSQDSSGFFGSAPTITFSDTEIDFLSFLTDTVLPFLAKIRSVLDPIKDVIGVLTADIEALSGIEGARDLLDVVDGRIGYQAGEDGIISLLDLAVLAEVPGIDTALAFFDVLDTIEDAYSLLSGQIGADGFYALGDLSITSDVRGGSFSLPNATGVVTGARDEIDDFLQTAFGGASPAALQRLFTASAGNLAAPVMADAQTALGYFFGQNVDILRFDLPKLAFTIGDRIAADGSFTGGSLADLVYVPIFFPGLSFEIEAALRAYIDIDFGYDTRGLQHYIESGTVGSPSSPLDPLKLLDGLYITDWGPNGQERPEVVLGAKFNFGAGLGIDRLAKFFVGGSIEGTVNLDITDGANGGVLDGKVYLDELAAELTDPNGFFQGYGSIEAYMTAYAELLFLSKEWHSESVELAGFNFGDSRPAPFDPQLASITDDKMLILHTGSNAGFRAITNKIDGDEQFSVSASGSDKVRVTGLGFDQLFSRAGLLGIIARGDTGDDLLNVGSTVTLAATLFGGIGQDVLGGGAGNDSLDGGLDADLIAGGAGNDLLLGGDGDDVLAGGAGADTLRGGLGFDTASYATAKASVQVALNGLAGIAGEGTGDRLSGIEKVVGADVDGVGDGIAVGGQSSGDIVFAGLRGDDTLEGGATNDVLIGGLGNDMLIGGGGSDTLSGGLGDDTYIVGSNSDVVDEDAYEEGGGIDWVVAGVNYTLRNLGDIENLELRLNGGIGEGNALANVIVGSGRDTQPGENWHDTLYGLDGADTISGRKGDDSIEGGDGADDIDGGTGDDTLWGEAGADTLVGGTGDDYLAGGTGTNRLEGGAGNDTYAVDDAGDAIVETTGGGSRDVLFASVDYAIGENVEIEALFGSDGSSTVPLSLRGNRFAQSLTGNAGDDVLEGLGGADTLTGSLGRDTASYEHAAAAVSLDLATQVFQGDAAGDVFIGIEAFRGTDGHGDTLRGSGGADDFNGLGGNDRLNGLAGADTLFGGDGADTLDGGSGNDLMAGGAGNDVYFVDSAQDIVDDDRTGYRSGGGGTDRIIASLNYTLNHADRADIEELQLAGSARAGTGNTLANLILGTGGADTLDGGSGADDLRGGSGNDLYFFDNMGDRVVEAAGGGIDEIRIATANFFADIHGAIFTFDMTADWLTQVEHAVLLDDARAIHARGNALNNRIVSNNQASSISGGDGDDTIDPGLGRDVVAGEGGTDRLVVDFSPYSGEGGVVLQSEGRVDFFNRFSGSPQSTLLYSGIESFDLTGTTGGDVLFGGALNDRLIGGDGNDGLNSFNGSGETIEGGAGVDHWLADLGAVATAILLDLTASQTEAAVLSNGTRVSGIERLTITLGGGNDRVSAADFRLSDAISGGAGNDTINPGLGNDSVDGGEGTDRLVVDFFAYSGERGNVIQGDNRFDHYNRFSGSPAATLLHENFESFDLRGTTEGDFLFGALLNDRLIGEAGDDVLNSFIGSAETIEGGEGNDRWLADLSGVSTPILLDLTASQTEAVILSNGTRVSGIEMLTLTLGSGDDHVSAAAFRQADTILGGAGNDTIDPGRGGDSVDGGEGVDRLVVDFFEYSGESGIVIQGDNRFDHYNRFSGSPAATLLHENFESFDLRGTTGGDFLFGALLADRLVGEAGDDVLNSFIGRGETIEGGEGNDRWLADLSGVATPILLDLTASQTEAAVLSNGTRVSGIEMLTITLGSGSDRVSAAAFRQADTILGGAGNDTIDPGRGNDSVDGGEGVDRLVVDFFAYSGERGNVIQGVDRFDHFNRFSGSPQATLLHANFESFDLRGTTEGDFLFGASLADRLVGEAGNDILNSFDGINETIEGGEGIDRWIADLSAAGSAILLDLTASQTVPALLSNGTLVSGIEMLTLTLGRGDDNVSTAPFAQADTIIGGAGNDTINPGRGGDSVDGGDGIDRLVVDFFGYSGESGNIIQGVDRFDHFNRFSGSPQATLLHANFESFDLRGTTGGDVLFGAGLADRLIGEAGDDVLNSFGGNGETIAGGEGNDRWIADLGGVGTNILLNLVTSQTNAAVLSNATRVSGIERLTLTTGSGNDRISTAGYSGADTILAGAGNDTVDPGLGADSVDGGAGTDRLIADFLGYSGEGGVVIQAVSRFDAYNRFSGSPFATLRYENFESFDLRGTTGGDFLFGGALGDRLRGEAGDDTLNTSTGLADTVEGGEGNDRWIADLGATRASVTLDLLTAQGAALRLASGTFVSGVEMLTLTLGSGHDRISTAGLRHADTIIAGGGNDTINPGLGLDSVDGGAGIDQLTLDFAGYSGEGGIVRQSAGRFDFYNRFSGSPQTTLLFTGIERFHVTGTTGSDSFFGGDLADTLIGGAGRDTLSGGLGNDIYDVDDTGDVVLENAGEGRDLIRTTVGLTLAAEVEDLLLLGAEGLRGIGNVLANRMTGGIGADTLDGAGGNDTLIGGAGADSLDGGLGADSLSGGLGDDVYRVDDVGDRTYERGGGGADTILASVNWTMGAHTDDLVLLGSADLSGVGNLLANRITGNAGENDLAGGRGADTLTGCAGNDIYRADRFDTLVENAGEGADTVISGGSFNLATALNVEALQLLGTLDSNGTGNAEDNLILGNGGNNRLEGDAGADTLLGGRGNDMLLGGDGDDSLFGGIGADRLFGGAGNDVYQISDVAAQAIDVLNGGLDLVQSSVSFVLTGHIENLALTGNAAITGTGNALANLVTGNGGANALSGEGGADTLVGGAGADTLTGGVGNDLLTGGTGSDWFRFGSLAERGDVITDFTPGQDDIAILASGFGGGLVAGALAAGRFVSHASNLATSASGTAQFIYNSATGLLSFDADGAGGAASVGLVTLATTPGMGAADIILV